MQTVSHYLIKNITLDWGEGGKMLDCSPEDFPRIKKPKFKIKTAITVRSLNDPVTVFSSFTK